MMFFNNAVLDKAVLVHSCCNFVFLFHYCMFLLLSDYLYSVGTYYNLRVLFAFVANEVVKLYIVYFAGFIPSGELFWRDDKLLLLPSQKIPKLKTIFLCFGILIATSFAYFIIAVLYGVELFSKCEETVLFGVILSALTFLPAVVHLGPYNTLNLMYGTKPYGSIALHCYHNIQLTLLGAWTGAFVIPLDWDRPWQEWPIPCTLGALFGSCIYNFVFMCNYLRQKRVSHKIN